MKMPSQDARTCDEQNERLAAAIAQEQNPLRNFLRRYVADQQVLEDILQDVFYELVVAYRLMKPIEHLRAWLFRVARNRITDQFRKQRPQEVTIEGEESERSLDQILPSPEGGPEFVYERAVLLEALEKALGELPEDQRNIFIAHEFEGLSFKELAARTGLNINTLISRKHYAVVYLREQLRDFYPHETRRSRETK
jgi:RNA polymerase sigma factor (sigma-70 family)